MPKGDPTQQQQPTTPAVNPAAASPTMATAAAGAASSAAQTPTMQAAPAPSMWDRFLSAIKEGIPAFNSKFEAAAHTETGKLASGETPEMQLITPQAAMTPKEQKEHPILTGAGEAIGEFTRPESAMMIAGSGGLGELSAAGKTLIPKLVSLGFSAQSLKSAYDQAPDFKKAMDKGDASEAQRILTHMVIDAASGVAAGGEALEGTELPARTKAAAKAFAEAPKPAEDFNFDNIPGHRELSAPDPHEEHIGKRLARQDVEHNFQHLPTYNQDTDLGRAYRAEWDRARAERQTKEGAEAQAPDIRAEEPLDFSAIPGHVEVSVPRMETAPQGGHAGGGVASVEELNRSGRFVKISRSGMPTDQNKTPDFTLKPGEAGYQVMPDGSHELKAGIETPDTARGLANYKKERGLPEPSITRVETPKMLAKKPSIEDPKVKAKVESAGAVYRGQNKDGLVEITLPREMTKDLPIEDRMKDFVSINLPADQVTPEAVRDAMNKKVVSMGGTPVTTEARLYQSPKYRAGQEKIEENMHHEAAHIVVGHEVGLTAHAIHSPDHPMTGSGAAAEAHFDLSSLPNMAQRPNGRWYVKGTFGNSGITQEHVDKLGPMWMAGAVAEHLISGKDLMSNLLHGGARGDHEMLRTFATKLGMNAEEFKTFRDAAIEKARNILTQPGVLDTIKAHSAVRHEGLPKKFHMDRAGVRDLLIDYERAKNGRETDRIGEGLPRRADGGTRQYVGSTKEGTEGQGSSVGAETTEQKVANTREDRERQLKYAQTMATQVSDPDVAFAYKRRARALKNLISGKTAEEDSSSQLSLPQASPEDLAIIDKVHQQHADLKEMDKKIAAAQRTADEAPNLPRKLELQREVRKLREEREKMPRAWEIRTPKMQDEKPAQEYDNNTGKWSEAKGDPVARMDQNSLGFMMPDGTVKIVPERTQGFEHSIYQHKDMFPHPDYLWDALDKGGVRFGRVPEDPKGAYIQIRQSDPETVRRAIDIVNRIPAEHFVMTLEDPSGKRIGEDFTGSAKDLTRQLQPYLTEKEPLKSEKLPKVTDRLGGFTVGKEIPNQSSIAASLTNYKTHGVRAVPIDQFHSDPKELFSSADDLKRTRDLAEQIKASGRIDPLIVVNEKEGPYVLEGAHRLGALNILGAKDVPALVVDDLDNLPQSKTEEEHMAPYAKDAEPEPLRVSTRLPAGPNAKGDPLKENLVVDRASVDPALEAKHAAQIGHRVVEYTVKGQPASQEVYPGFNVTKADLKNPKAVLDRFQRHLVDNLKYLWNRVPEATREQTKRWYTSANGLAKKEADKYGITHQQAAAVIATQSPQRDWDMNVSLARRILDIWHTKQNTAMTPEMEAKAKELTPKSADLKNAWKSIKGKKLSDLTDTVEQAAWLRIYDEAHNPREFESIDPGTGESLGFRKKKGEEGEEGDSYRAAWGGLNTISKAISVLKDGSRKNISKQLGGAHKVRSFYNNIIDPDSKHPDVTIDTHAVAAALLRPLSGKSIEVNHNLGGASSSKPLGIQGTYPYYAEAYRQAAKELDIPYTRMLQSVVWEEVRKMFPAPFKAQKANREAINKIWRDYGKGKYSADEARQRIADYTESTGVGKGKSSPSVDVGSQRPVDEGELSGPRVPGQSASGNKPRGGNDSASRVASTRGASSRGGERARGQLLQQGTEGLRSDFAQRYPNLGADIPTAPRIPDRGQFAAVKTFDGQVFVDTTGEKTHIQLIHKLKIPPDQVESGGWVKDGDYEGTARSDAGRYGEQARAAARTLRRRNLKEKE